MKRLLCLILAILLVLVLAGCGDTGKLGAYSKTAYQPLSLTTTHYDGGFFSLDIPVGWELKTVGEYTEFGFMAYDPEAPERRFFLYCKVGVFLKSQAAKNEYGTMAAWSGSEDTPPYYYGVFAALPVMEPSTEGFFGGLESLMLVSERYGYTGLFSDPSCYPRFTDIEVLETFPNNSPITPTTLDNSILRITFTPLNEPGMKCQGLVAAQATDFIAMRSPMSGTDLGYRGAYNVMGVTAPDGELMELEDDLQKCLASFSFTQEYLEEASRVTQEQTAQSIANANALQAVFDSCNAAWSARQTTYDILSQKQSDATLGYERLYDPDTGEIYQAELGFYDDYGRSNTKLELVDDTTEQYYLAPIDYVITK